jgi:hypothetical protein
MIRSINLPKVFSFISIPPSARKYIKPMLLASIGLHAFVLLAPFPTEPVKLKPPRQKTVRLTPLPTIRKTAKIISKSPLPAKALLKVRIVAVSQKGLVLPSPPKKRVVTTAPSPKGKPHAEKKQAEKPPVEKKQAELKPQSPAPVDKAPTQGPKTSGDSSAGMDNFMQNIMGSLSTNSDVVPDLFSSPIDFFPNYKKPDNNTPPGYDVPEPPANGIEDLRLVKSKTPPEVYKDLLASLSQNGYRPTSILAEYSGGQLYKIEKDSLMVYLNLVPTANGADTVVVTWSTNPSN